MRQYREASSLGIYSIALKASMATWRNGSAFGFDRHAYQKVAGSSPAVVIFLHFTCRPLSSAVRALGLWSEREHLLCPNSQPHKCKHPRHSSLLCCKKTQRRLASTKLMMMQELIFEDFFINCTPGRGETCENKVSWMRQRNDPTESLQYSSKETRLL